MLNVLNMKAETDAARAFSSGRMKFLQGTRQITGADSFSMNAQILGKGYGSLLDISEKGQSISIITMLRRNTLFARLFPIGALMSIALSSAVEAETTKSTSLAFECSHTDGIDPGKAEEICSEFAAFVKEKYPAFDLRTDRPVERQVYLQITRANERGIGMEVAWTDDNGTETAGIPLQMTFFDRNSDPHMRKRFYAEFLRQNPIPF